jgi:transposase-like protein
MPDRKDLCARGHDLNDPEIGYTRPDGSKRECKVCQKDRRQGKSLAKGSMTNYTDEEIELGMATLARFNGNKRRASKECGIPDTTLTRWRDRYPERYQELEEELVPIVRARVAERSLQIAEQAADIEAETLELLRGKLAGMDGRDLSNTLRNTSTTKGIALTHANNFQSPPAKLTEPTDPLAILAGLQRLGVIEGKAEELPEDKQIEDAEVVDA